MARIQHRFPPDRDLVYLYDGSFEGLCCCIYESFHAKEIPAAIFSNSTFQATLYPVRQIAADVSLANRVMHGLASRVSPAAADFLRLSFLCCHDEKELLALRFVHQAFVTGPSVMNMLQNDIVNAMHRAIRFLNNEAHLCLEFLRFSDYENGLAARISPKNFVLPLLAPHFADRFPEERFLIFDSTHKTAAYYEPYEMRILSVESLELPDISNQEGEWRHLWKQYYKTIAVEGRENPLCRMTHCPKHYWENMTELSSRPEIADSTPAEKYRIPEKI